MSLTRFEITSRVLYADGQSFGDTGPFVQFDGTAHFAVDPEHRANKAIVDIGFAPRNGEGLVEFSSDFTILMPKDPARGNRHLFRAVAGVVRLLLIRD